MIKIESKGGFKKTRAYFEKLLEFVHKGTLDKYGRTGVALLRDATPVDTGLTSNSWTYDIVWYSSNKVGVVWSNNNVQNGANIAVLLQYGHSTVNGSWVEGRDYINTALQPLFDTMAKNVWKELVE